MFDSVFTVSVLFIYVAAIEIVICCLILAVTLLPVAVKQVRHSTE